MNHLRFVFLKLNQMLWIAVIFFLLYAIPLWTHLNKCIYAFGREHVDASGILLLKIGQLHFCMSPVARVQNILM